jgi:hypothetical protein
VRLPLFVTLTVGRSIAGLSAAPDLGIVPRQMSRPISYRGAPLTIIQLYREDEEYLSSHDAILRLAPAFRHVVLDRVRGEAEYEKEWDKCIRLKAPEVILQTYSLATCRTVWVEIADADGPDDWIRFPLWSRRAIFIEFASAEESHGLRPTVEKLAGLLEYEVDAD